MEQYADIIREAATRHGLEPELVAAVVWQESSGDTTAMRLEQGFYRLYLRKPDIPGYFPPETPRQIEIGCRAISWGLMQVMGQVAREEGFKGVWLSDLCDHPELGLEYGCKHLARHLRNAKGNQWAALLRYNGGGDPNYPGKIKGHMAGLSKLAPGLVRAWKVGRCVKTGKAGELLE